MSNNTKHKKKKAPKPTNETHRKVKNFLGSDDFAKTRGVFDIIFSVFLFVCFISYLIKGGNEPNWCGSLGFWFANILIENTFGIATLGLCFLIFVRGFRLLGRPLLDRARVNYVTLFWMSWVSITVAYIGYLAHNESNELVWQILCGSFGYYIAKFLFGALKIGFPILMVFLAFAFLFLVHHVRPKMPKFAQNIGKGVNNEVKADLTKQTDDKAKELPAILAHHTAAPEEETLDIPSEDTLKANANRMNLLKEALTGLRKRAEKAMTEPDENEDNEGADFEESDEATPHFSIDDEFDRINHKARERADKEAADEADISREENTGDDNAAGKNASGPTFTIIDRQPDAPTVPVETEDASTSTSNAGDGLRHHTIDEPYDPRLDLPHYQMPATNMLIDWERNNVKVTNEELLANNDKIIETLQNYGINITDITAAPGPTVTLYEIKPAPGVRISKIKSLEDDIALSLAALGIRIIAPIPGRGTVGIEVPNAKPQIVSMKTMLESDAFQKNTKFELPIAFGKTISNESFITDLAKMPHLLMAGATGTGKSVGLNAVIASLLYKKHPSELKFVMVDPKKVELSLYNKIERHYLAKLPDSDDGGEVEPIITDVKRVVRTLNSLCIEMDNRYDLLKKAQVRKIKEYNDKIINRQLIINENDPKGHHFLPYIVLVIDEFADLIMTAGKEIETPICRLAQLARAVGIHLIIATQRPTTNIITGTIKANFPARIAFRVTSAIDSRTILDCGGAQQLIGRGDMLISLSGSDLSRCQCALIETEEIEKLANFISEQEGFSDDKMFTLPEYLDENDAPNKDFDPKAKDEFFNDAARLVVSSQFGSTSLLQRKLQLGYNRAGRIIDQLEAAGIVGPYNGSKAREVLIKDEVELEELLRGL